MDTVQLEKQIAHLKSFYKEKMDGIVREYERKSAAVAAENVKELERLRQHYESRYNELKSNYEQQISELEQELAYSKEMNEAQRIMMNDAMAYAAKLEAKLQSEIKD